MESIHFGPQAEQFLITGATGFIGRLLVPALLADGKQVTVLTRNPQQASKSFPAGVSCIGQMSDLPVDQKISVIINLAGARILGTRWSAARRQILRESRIGLTKTVIDWIAHANHKPRLLLSTSAIGYYGVQPQGDNTVLKEDSPPQAVFMSQLCQEWETAAQQANAHGVRVVCMRLGFVLGRQGSLPMMMLPVKLGLAGALGSGRQWLSWIHVQDVLRGMGFLCNSAELPSGAFNFTAPEPVHQKQFMETAAKVLKRPCFMPPLPGMPVKLLLGEQADLLLEGQRVVPERLQAAGFRFTFPDPRSALKDLLQAPFA